MAVEGRLQICPYEDSHGFKRKAAEDVAENVKFLDRSKESNSQDELENYGGSYEI